MCDVSLPAMPGRAVATLVRAEVVMTGGDTVTVTQQPSPGQEHRGRGDGVQQLQHLIRYDSVRMPRSMMC